MYGSSLFSGRSYVVFKENKSFSGIIAVPLGSSGNFQNIPLQDFGRYIIDHMHCSGHFFIY
jgi:hypothetical protein